LDQGTKGLTPFTLSSVRSTLPSNGGEPGILNPPPQGLVIDREMVVLHEHLCKKRWAIIPVLAFVDVDHSGFNTLRISMVGRLAL
jgi:hypothetical protein